MNGDITIKNNNQYCMCVSLGISREAHISEGSFGATFLHCLHDAYAGSNFELCFGATFHLAVRRGGLVIRSIDKRGSQLV